MFDFAWSEIAIIGVVALVAIGPKDMPVALRAVAGMVKKARKMASEFQTHVDEMVREANLHEVRQQIQDLKSFNFKEEIEKAVDADGSLRATLNENPLSGALDPLPEVPVATRTETSFDNPEGNTAAPAAVTSEAVTIETPSFLPPEYAPHAPQPEPQAVIPPVVVPPAFIPPGTEQHSA